MIEFRVHMADDPSDFEDIKGFDEEAAAKEFAEEKMYEDFGYDFPVEVICNGKFFSIDIEMVPEVQVSDLDPSDEQQAAWKEYVDGLEVEK